MYESPIQLAIGEMQMKYEDEVYKCIQQYGINVDKDELIKALQYDRNQYEKGYRDGYRDAAMKLVERLKEVFYNDCYVLHRNIFDEIAKEMVGDV